MLLRQVLAVFGAFLATAFLVVASPVAQPAEGGVITVYRGASATTLRFPAAGPLQVQRGAALKTLAYAAKNDDGAQPRRVLAGERLWVIDSQAGRLTTCALKNSIQVGRKDIRCFTRALPASLLPTAD